MKIVERSTSKRRVHSCRETPLEVGLWFKTELRRLRQTQPNRLRGHLGRVAGGPSHAYPTRAVRAAMFP
jgi:hypothetical protein